MVNNKDFIQRLEKILKEYELSASTFADKIQVGRATISHILSGRNKPSLDFVMKIVQTFSQVDLYWLLEGKGTFPKTEEHSTFTPTTNSIKQYPNSTKETSEDKDATTTIANSLYHHESSKKIKRIIIFMEDGTFESYETS
ncbi:helix-turn-helix domain-containing protein [uncultured Dokdonia sp.]|uniref:helix-turn-helix domain-containing protein n=1 Tax=uncultured Dokdonia sp. TaxID=575653 RepID=UPI00263611D9|nr:helix-turn-helix domain-containing protein [uncultured Dokdonia sp.]